MRKWAVHACVVAAVIGGEMAFVPPLRAHAGGSCITDWTGDVLNTWNVQTDETATPTANRPYADITSACVTADGATTGGGIQQTVFQIQVARPIPAFPTTDGDLGITFEACVDVNGPLSYSPLVVGIGHHGEPVFDGPYPPSQGWKYCAFATTTPVDQVLHLAPIYGVEILDPAGGETFVDSARLHDTQGAATISPPGGLAIGSSMVTMYLPDTVLYTVNAVSPPLVGIPHIVEEPFLEFGLPLTNMSVRTTDALKAALPFPVCVNKTDPTNLLDCSYDPTRIVGPIQGVAPLPGAVEDWAPGRIICTGNLPTTCSASPAPSGQWNGYDLGLVPAPGATPTCFNPVYPGPPTPPFNNPEMTCTTLTGTYTYNPCQAGNTTPYGQDQGDLYTLTDVAPSLVHPCTVSSMSESYTYSSEWGRIMPWALPRVNGFTVGPGFLPDNWNVL